MGMNKRYGLQIYYGKRLNEQPENTKQENLNAIMRQVNDAFTRMKCDLSTITWTWELLDQEELDRVNKKQNGTVGEQALRFVAYADAN